MAVRFELEFGKSNPRAKQVDDDPLRIIVAGDFYGDHGRAADGGPQAHQGRHRQLRRRSGEDQTVGALRGRLGGRGVGTRRLPSRSTLRAGIALRALQRFAESTAGQRHFADAAAEISSSETEDKPKELPPETSDSMFARLLGNAPAEHGVDRMIRQIVAPYVVAAADPRQAEMIAAVDSGIADAMRGVLHEPRLQAIEAAWRGLYWLVSTIDPGETVLMTIIQATGDDLIEVIDRAGRNQTGLLIANQRFGSKDIDALAAVAAKATEAQVPVVAGAASELLGTPAIADEPDERKWAEQPRRCVRSAKAGRPAGSASPCPG